MTEEIHDTSHLDRYLQTRQRVSLLNASWRPALAGAAGAALVIAAVYVTLPKFSVREVVVDHVVQRDVSVDHVIPKDVVIEIPRIVVKDIEPPKAVPSPVATLPPPAPVPADLPKTPDEQKFVDKPEYKTAVYRGRIVKSTDGRALSFADGQSFVPKKFDVNGKVIDDFDQDEDSDAFINDLGMCTQRTDNAELWTCVAFHGGKTIPIPVKPAGASPQQHQSSIGSTPALDGMIHVDIDLGHGPVEAIVDSGNSWPISMSEILADMLVKRNLAIRAGSAKSEFADGIVHNVDIILIKQIAVEGRVLRDVEASVSHGPARILLGMGALNRLGPFKIDKGRFVFTGAQPT